ncbi:MAG: OmpA family protein [Candidatus Zixiibacteriota bacterium]
MKLSTFLCLFICAFMLTVYSPASAGIGGSLKNKVTKKVEKKAEEKTDNAIDKAVDNAAGDGESGATGESATSAGAVESSEGGGEGMKPGEGVWLNYDFVPGDRVIFFEDFSKSPVGDFPQRIQFVQGNMEVAEWRGQRWLRCSNDSHFEFPLPEVLPLRFTLEFDFYGPTSANTIEIRDGSDQQDQHNWLRLFWYLNCGIYGPTTEVAMTEVPARAKEKIVHCRVMGDGKYLKVYINEIRVANVPASTFARSSSLPVHIWAAEDKPAMITNIRIAEGGKKIMYDQLMAEGKVVTQGILFASGSDVIQAESTPTLKEIGTMLKDHADLKVSIEGHTDSVGEDAANQDLSKRRAASVKAYLMEKYSIEDARLQAQGYGETKPVDSNDTPEGRQNNRRVELIKL